MARKKKELGKEVLVTLKGCSIYNKRGKILDIKEYGARTLYTLEIDGKAHEVNARFCIPAVGKNELKEKGMHG